ncbi:PIG-L family deacetylase [Kitasatospora sp. NPDC058201]|uniref:PIG-L family deacetylase n=1 Tax=unclassified Kitasatospora TaxID=2633591 RepID=UPI00366A16BC
MALVVAVSQTWTVPPAPSSAPDGASGPPTARPDGRPATVVQIVAHQDDDLLFMNPDLSSSIRAGFEVTTVYITGGAAGAGAAYAAHRQDGIRLAYARMAGEAAGTGAGGCADDPGAACWDREDYRPVPGGPVAERFTLRADRSLQLVFLSLPEYADSAYLGGNALRRLWESRDSAKPAETTTLDMDGPATLWPQVYNGARLIDVLRAVLVDQDPTLVRVQDPAPDPTLWNHHAEHDHPDHISAAWFADAAVAAYTATGRRGVVVEHYRDYNTWSSPAVLPFTETATKQATFRTYTERDANIPTGAAFAVSPYASWQSRQYLRYPRSTQAVAADRTGALHAFAVESGSLHEWAEDADKTWQGPVVDGGPGGPLAAGVTVARRQDGGLEVFGQRSDTGEIVSRVQGPAGGWVWHSHGSPDVVAGPQTSKLANRALQVSVPVVTADGDGRLQMFVRNRSGGISTKGQTAPNGAWSNWAELGGTGVQGAPTAVTTHDGRIEVFAVTVKAASRPRVLHWSQPEPDGALVLDRDFPDIAPVGGISVATTSGGRLALYYRQVSGTDPVPGRNAYSYTMSLVQAAPDGRWTPGAGPVGNGPDHGGTGEPAVVSPGATTERRTVVAVRNRNGGLSVNRQGTDGRFGDWTDLGGFVVGVPAAGVDRDGLTDLVVLGPDGRLHHNRQRTDGSFGAWSSVGDP